MVRCVRALGREHADPRPHARRGRPLAPRGDPARRLARGALDRFERAVTPVLDAMQIIPAFAYLMPVVILFSVGPGAAVITTMIYAIPPAIRITALGIRGVPANTVEAALAMGSTRRRRSRRCVCRSRGGCCSSPSTRRSVRALDGRDRRAHRRQGPRRRGDERPRLVPGPGTARWPRDRRSWRWRSTGSTESVAERTNPARRHLTDELPPEAAPCLGRHGGSPSSRWWAVSRLLGVGADYSRTTARDWLLARIQSVLDYVSNPDTGALPRDELDRRAHRPVRARSLPELPRRDAVARDAASVSRSSRSR